MFTPWRIGIGAAVLSAGVAGALLHDPASAPLPARPGKAPEPAPPRKDSPSPAASAPAARTQTAAPAAPAPAEAAPDPGARHRKDLGAAVDRLSGLLAPPAAKERMRAGTLAFVRERYGDLIGEWGLSPEVRAEVEAILAERLSAEERLDFLILDERVGEEEILRAQEEAFAAARRDLALRLDPVRLYRLEEFEAALPQRQSERRVDQGLAPLKLESSVQTRIRAIVLEEERALPPEVARLLEGARPGRKTAADIRAERAMELDPDPKARQARISAALRQADDRVRGRARPFLSPEQMSDLERRQDDRIRRMERSAALEAVLLGSGLGDLR